MPSVHSPPLAGRGFEPIYYCCTSSNSKVKKNRLPKESISALTGIRTPVLALKGLRPGPLDDEGDSEQNSTRPPNTGQGRICR